MEHFAPGESCMEWLVFNKNVGSKPDGFKEKYEIGKLF